MIAARDCENHISPRSIQAMRQKLELVVWILAKVSKKALKVYAGTMIHYDC